MQQWLKDVMGCFKKILGIDMISEDTFWYVPEPAVASEPDLFSMGKNYDISELHT